MAEESFTTYRYADMEEEEGFKTHPKDDKIQEREKNGWNLCMVNTMI